MLGEDGDLNDINSLSDNVGFNIIMDIPIHRRHVDKWQTTIIGRMTMNIMSYTGKISHSEPATEQWQKLRSSSDFQSAAHRIVHTVLDSATANLIAERTAEEMVAGVFEEATNTLEREVAEAMVANAMKKTMIL